MRDDKFKNNIIKLQIKFRNINEYLYSILKIIIYVTYLGIHNFYIIQTLNECIDTYIYIHIHT